MFREAFHDFKWWFKNITGIEWDNRLDGLPTPKDKFKYNVPKLGRPVGFLPAGKKAPTWDEDSESEDLVYDSSSEFEDEPIEDGDEGVAKKQGLDTSVDGENSVETRLINAMAGRQLKQPKPSLSKDNRAKQVTHTRPPKDVKKYASKKPAQSKTSRSTPLDSAILVKGFVAGDTHVMKGLQQTASYPAADDDIDSHNGLPNAKTSVRPQKQLKMATKTMITPTKQTSAFETQYDMRPAPFRHPPSTPSGKRKRPSHAAESINASMSRPSSAGDHSTLVSPSPSTPRPAKTPRATAATLSPHKWDTSSLSLKPKKYESPAPVTGHGVLSGTKRSLGTESGPTNPRATSPGGTFTSTAVFFPTSMKKESKRTTAVIDLTGN
jgi:hypothetical protein